MKRIVFLTGTRADFGKLKSLIEVTIQASEFEVHIFATGMHMQAKYGGTVNEIEKSGYPNIYKYINQSSESGMDLVLSRTVDGLSGFCREIQPDLIIVHGDRVEALAGAIVGSFNNILVGHIEGGEVSGTIDELIRHSVSKLSHVHFVANDTAKKRLIQMGEAGESVYVIGSPDVDLMLSNHLPDLASVKAHYEIGFGEYAILLFHPTTTENHTIESDAQAVVDAVKKSNLNYIVIYPNNDLGSSSIFRAYEGLKGSSRFKMFPSVRFESFLTLLKNAKVIVGNSSSGIREAPYYGIPVVNIGTRQNNRALHDDIINTGYSSEEILTGIKSALSSKPRKTGLLFGEGKSDTQFIEILRTEQFWAIAKQKYFRDI